MVVTDLVVQNLDLVRECSRRVHAGWRTERADLLAAGSLGLIRASWRYDPVKGDFRHYAQAWIVGAMRDRVRADFCPAPIVSLDEETSREDEPLVFCETVSAPGAPATADLAMAAVEADTLIRVLRFLPPKSRRVIELRYWHDLLLHEIGDALGVSESRVSQIHTAALQGLRLLLGDSMST